MLQMTKISGPSIVDEGLHLQYDKTLSINDLKTFPKIYYKTIEYNRKKHYI